MNKDKMKLDKLKEVAKNITKEELIKDYKEYKKIQNKRGYDIYLTKEDKSMELEEAITILEATIGEFKYLQSTLDEDERELYEHGVQTIEIKAIETVLQELKNSIPKKKIEDKKKELEEIRTKTGDVYVDVILAIKILQELLEDK